MKCMLVTLTGMDVLHAWHVDGLGMRHLNLQINQLEIVTNNMNKYLTCLTQTGSLDFSQVAELCSGEGVSMPDEYISVNEWECCISLADAEDVIKF